MSPAPTDRPSPQPEVPATPTGPDGAPLRVTPAWWPAHPTDAALAAAAAHGTPILGARREAAGVELVETTFLWEGDGAEHTVLMHLNTLTDRHREDVTGALAPRVPGTRWHALTYLLASDVVLGYQIVVRDRIPADIGAGRAGWRDVHAAGRPDPRNARTLTDGFGHTSSLFAGPDAREHPEWAGSAPPMPEAAWSAFHELGDDERAVTLWQGSGAAPRRLLVLFDGHTWRRLDTAAHLGRRAGAWDLLLIDSASLPQRARELPDPDRAADLVTDAIARASAASGLRWDAERVVLAGQSYGGLAAASLVLRRPDLAGRGIAQSGSYWFAGDGDARTGRGDLLRWIADAPAPARRLVVQAGSEEGEMAALSAELAGALAAHGALVGHRTYRGGHDYAWWRHGLSDGLDLLEAEGRSLSAPGR